MCGPVSYVELKWLNGQDEHAVRSQIIAHQNVMINYGLTCARA